MHKRIPALDDTWTDYQKMYESFTAAGIMPPSVGQVRMWRHRGGVSAKGMRLFNHLFRTIGAAERPMTDFDVTEIAPCPTPASPTSNSKPVSTGVQADPFN